MCLHCQASEVADEGHVILRCDALKDLRVEYGDIFDHVASLE